MTDRDRFAADYNVPRETMERLDIYADLLRDWQTRMNLVGPSTVETMWTRHFADSAQLAPFASTVDETTTWLDIGSGAGFPALVLALLCPGRFHLVESTAKKARFLEAVAASTGLEQRIAIHAERVEAMASVGARIITARACASLRQLFDWGVRHGPGATWLLLKGQSVGDEIREARQSFTAEIELFPSRTDPRGHIVVARNVRRLRR